MKKISVFVLSLIALAVSIFPVTAGARGGMTRGDKTLGVCGGFASYNTSGYAGLYFQYSFAKHVRIAPDLGCIFSHKDKSALVLDIDMQFPFRLTRGLNVYPLAGVAFNSWDFKSDGKENRLGADCGAGFDLCLTPTLKMSVEGKYTFMKHTHGALVTLGLGYNF